MISEMMKPTPTAFAKMTGWFNPGELSRTLVKVAISEALGVRADYRMIEALSAPQDLFDYSPREELWIDFLADLGDGWNPTYAIASLLAKPTLKVKNQVDLLPRADILFMGGDEVYPDASQLNYRKRLEAPYEAALPRKQGQGEFQIPGSLMTQLDQCKPEPMPVPPSLAAAFNSTGHLLSPEVAVLVKDKGEHWIVQDSAKLITYSLAKVDSNTIGVQRLPSLFAIPGNHDWYDGLMSFTRLFCQQRNIGGWQTRQARSYFAVKLPHNWLFLGVDIQLESDIDPPQVDYFQKVLSKMESGAKVILCTAKPDWIYAALDFKHQEQLEKNLAFLEDRIIRPRGGEVKIRISGDLHHYRRHQAMDGRMNITSGGGGAFLSPTHGPIVDVLTENGKLAFRLQKEFPERKLSQRLAYRNLLFPVNNPKFGIVPALLYLPVAWLLSSYAPPARFLDLRFFFASLWVSLLGVLWLVVLFAMTTLYADKRRRVGWLLGVAHGAAHLAAVFLLVSLAARVGPYMNGSLGILQALTPGALSLLRLAIFLAAGGYLVGSWLVGMYLLVALNSFRLHEGHAFSALRIQDFKHFLRFHIDRKGGLTMYVLALRRVPRNWKPGNGTPGAPVFVPDPEDALQPDLIERVRLEGLSAD